MNEDRSQWPSFTRLPPAVVARYEEATRNGQYDLNRSEQVWRDLQPTIKEQGYQLRPRYQPDWIPSWLGTNLDPMFCEDAIRPIVPHVIDANRTDGLVVSIKRVSKTSNEITIGQSLSSMDLLWNPLNHCVPILDVFADPIEQDTSYIVMPHLRPFDDPEFCFIGEIIDFVGQTLQGIFFIHSNRVAHRDCTGLNIMMDGAPLYPEGFHPIRMNYSTDGVFELKPLPRIDHPVRYYFIDFGLSTQFAPGDPPFVVGAKGRDQDVPELSCDVPYNAYKVDIFTLGNLYRKELFEKYYNLDFLVPLIEIMTQEDPNLRPSASVAMAAFRRIHSKLDNNMSNWRLRSRNESISERVFHGTVAVAKGGINSLIRFVGQ
ncbi:hypothetical protein SERLA73DRAFT_86540 [Serpula lacrymans var. lacrymans S7.3]|uniref:Protein kinase domain-containing protein n=2 Tax=Serpula lacrymans var. lacrymans TaxID=341189 RepID=F8PQL2_SERL3|nr:uncharacterized protein SERLADRAFT_447230 [Serpula lacrymans var. lacrymans S7.9]EGO02260.1 hypothetical protein SERLA73DRAFT_86540 [Serpula lacrymans var. lacrymans S7.3]EGO28005.1 hypothetical protein SERLADRAFT_447230 [Serpula lacrymans var. lacrymans S7.9]